MRLSSIARPPARRQRDSAHRCIEVVLTRGPTICQTSAKNARLLNRLGLNEVQPPSPRSTQSKVHLQASSLGYHVESWAKRMTRVLSAEGFVWHTTTCRRIENTVGPGLRRWYRRGRVSRLISAAGSPKTRSWYRRIEELDTNIKSEPKKVIWQWQYSPYGRFDLCHFVVPSPTLSRCRK